MAGTDIRVGRPKRQIITHMALVVPSTLSSPSPVSALFSRYDINGTYDEMFDAAGRPRSYCRPLFEDLRAASHDRPRSGSWHTLPLRERIPIPAGPGRRALC